MTEEQTQLVLEHRAFARKIAARYLRRARGHTIDELAAAAEDGLMAAARKFDPSRGVKFTTYANRWVRAHVRRFLHYNMSMVHEGERKTMRAGKFVTRTDAPYNDYDWCGPTPDVDAQLDAKRALTACFRGIDEREQQVLVREIVDGASCTEIGEELGTSRERARQLRNRALRRARQTAWAEGLIEDAALKSGTRERALAQIERAVGAQLNGVPITTRALIRELRRRMLIQSRADAHAVQYVLARMEHIGAAKRTTEKSWLKA